MTTSPIAIATGTRADWGLLSPIARELTRRQGLQPMILATNMHLLGRYGDTLGEIEADGLAVTVKVPLPALEEEGAAADSAQSRVRAMAQCMSGMADALGRLRPRLLVVLGDRFEMLATASAALMMGIPIAHIAGGEISEGAVDDSIRHAITKMSAWHLTATEEYRRRVIQMGEQPDRVVCTGAIGVWNALNVTPLPLAELRQSLGFDIDSRTLLVTYHPATLDIAAPPAQRMAALLEALDRFADHKVIITYPNNDAGGAELLPLIRDYADRQPGRVLAIPSLGRQRYMSALRHVAAVVGNSSSGIVEVPSMHLPTVDIGMRQRGRLAAASVRHCGDSAEEIAAAISYALSPEGRYAAAKAVNPYESANTLHVITDTLLHAARCGCSAKRFHDLPTTAL